MTTDVFLFANTPHGATDVVLRPSAASGDAPVRDDRAGGPIWEPIRRYRRLVVSHRIRWTVTRTPRRTPVFAATEVRWTAHRDAEELWLLEVLL